MSAFAAAGYALLFVWLRLAAVTRDLPTRDEKEAPPQSLLSTVSPVPDEPLTRPPSVASRVVPSPTTPFNWL